MLVVVPRENYFKGKLAKLAIGHGISDRVKCRVEYAKEQQDGTDDWLWSVKVNIALKCLQRSYYSGCLIWREWTKCRSLDLLIPLSNHRKPVC